MKGRRIRSRDELLAVIRGRRDQLDIAHVTIDAISGVADGYTSKLLCDPPMKQFGPISLDAILGALALQIVEITIIEDAEQAAKIGHRWVRRKRRSTAPEVLWCVAKPSQPSFDFATTEEVTE
jgi:hypothetical protein